MRILNKDGIDLFDPRHLVSEPSGRFFRSRLPNVATELELTSDKAYFVYVGRIAGIVPLQYVRFYVSTPATGSGNVEVGLFSTPAAPNGESQSLSKLAVATTSNIDSLLSTGMKTNSNANFQYTAMPGTYLWAGIRAAGYSTQPKLAGVCMDFGEGLVLSTASAGSLSGSGPWTGSLISAANYLNMPIAPDLRVRWNPAG